MYAGSAMSMRASQPFSHALTRPPIHIATSITTSVFSSAYDSRSSPAGACSTGSSILSSTMFAAVS